MRRIAASIGLLLAAAIGCAVGAEQEPGCHVDADCDPGWMCRAGACFRATTGLTDPAMDGGEAGDADDAG